MESRKTPLLDRQKVSRVVPAIAPYVVAFLAVLLTLAIRLAIDPILGSQVPYAFFFFSIVLVKRFWGRGPALLATLLGGIAAWYFLLETRFSFRIADPRVATNLAVFMALGTGISFLGEVSKPLQAAVNIWGREVRVRVLRQIAVLAGAVVVLAGMVLILERNFTRSQDAETWMAHTYQVMSGAQRLRSTMDDASAAERKFVLTGDARGLLDYNAAVAAVPHTVNDLKTLTSDDPKQQARCVEIRRLADQRLSTLSHALELRKSLGGEAAVNMMRSGEALETVDNLRFMLNAFTDDERQVLRARTADAERRASRGRWVLGLGSGALLLLLVFASVVIDRETIWRDQITKALRRHAGLLEQAHDSLFICRLRGAIEYWGRGAQTLYGYSHEEALGQFSHQLLKTQHLLGIGEVDSVLEREGHWEGQLAQTTKDGRKLIVEARWSLAVDEDGNKTVLQANSDITEQKRIEERLRNSEAQFRTLANAIPQLCWMADADGWIFWYNERWYNYTGTTQEQMDGWGWQSVHDPEVLPQVLERWKKSLTTGKPFDMVFPLRGADGAFRPFLTRVTPVCDQAGKVVRWFGTNTDISEQRRTEEALRASEQQLKHAQQVANVGSWEWDVQTGSLWWSEQVYRQLGEDPARFTPTHEAFLGHLHPGDRSAYEEAVQHALAGTGSYDLELRMVRADGTSCVLLTRGEVRRGLDGRPLGMSGVCLDITARKRAEQEIRESEAVLRSFFDSPGMMRGMVELVDGCIVHVFCNEAAAQLYGLDQKSIGGKTATEAGASDAVTRSWVALYERARSTGKPVSGEYARWDAQGRERWLLATTSYMGIGQSGNPRFAYTILDLTERKRAEDALQENEARLRALGDNLPQGALYRYRLDANGQPHVDFISAGIERLTGVPAGKFMTDPTTTIKCVVPEDRERLTAAIALSAQQMTRFEVEVRHKHRVTDETHWCLLRSSPTRFPDGSIVWDGIELDITGRKRAEEALRRSEADLRDAQRIARVGNFTWEVATNTETWSEEVYRIFGRDPNLPKPQGDESAQLYTPETWVKLREAQKKSVQSGTSHELEMEVVRADGTKGWLSAHAEPEFNGNGQVVRLRGTVQDITERKQMEAERVLLATAIEQASETVIVTDRNAKIQYVNPAFTRVTGYTRAEAIGQNPRVLKSGKHDAKFYEDMWATLNAGELWQGEFTNRRKDGTLYNEEVTIAPVRNDAGEITNFIAIKSDVTERRRAETALRENERTLRMFVQHAPAAIAMLDRDMRYLVVSERWKSSYRVGDRDLRGLSHYEVIPEIPERWKEVHQRCLRFGEVERCDRDAFPHPDGSVDWVSWEIRPWRKADNTIGGVIIFSELITERVKAEQALEESELRYRQLFDRSHSGLALYETVYDEHGNPCDFRFLDVNPAFERLTGLKGGEIVGRTLLEVLPATEDSWIELYSQVAASGWPTEFELSAGKKYFSGECYLPRPGQVAVSFMDVTERKTAQDALKRSEYLLRESQRVGRIGSLEFDIATGRIFGSAALDEISGVAAGSAKDLAGWRALIHPAEREAVMAELRRAISEKKPFERDYRMIRPSDGAERWVSAKSELVLDEQARPLKLIGTLQDVTERRQVEEALQESELRYRQLFERSESAVGVYEMLYDAEGQPCDFRYLSVNPAFERITGRMPGQILGRTALEVTPSMDDYWFKLFGRVAATGEPATFEHYAAHVEKHFSGTVYSPRPNQVAVTFMDVTERIRAEEALRRMNIDLEGRVRSRTAALETANRELEAFAHSVSHDLRAPLRGIDGWSLALLEDYGDQLNAQGRKYLDRVRSEAQHMGKLIDDLLHLSRVSRAQLIPSPVDLSALTEAIVARLKEAHADRAIEFVVAPHLACTGDARLLEVALTNLLENAVKFTGPRSPARIEVGKTQCEGRCAFFVRDNGVGFDMAYAGMLFEPFQRLHKASEFPGTGIGLATVQRVVHRHGGEIWAEGQVGQGATIYFTVGE